MHALPVLNLHSLQTPQLFGAPSFAYPSICLSGLHKKLVNLHMGPGTQHLPVLQWGSDPSVSLMVICRSRGGWCSVILQYPSGVPIVDKGPPDVPGFPVLCSHVWADCFCPAMQCLGRCCVPGPMCKYGVTCWSSSSEKSAHSIHSAVSYIDPPLLRIYIQCFCGRSEMFLQCHLLQIKLHTVGTITHTHTHSHVCVIL